jgi:hypothetical protein
MKVADMSFMIDLTADAMHVSQVQEAMERVPSTGRDAFACRTHATVSRDSVNTSTEGALP